MIAKNIFMRILSIIMAINAVITYMQDKQEIALLWLIAGILLGIKADIEDR